MTLTTKNTLRYLAFDNSFQANIITTVSTGNIILANWAACNLLGYSKKELLTKSRDVIFNINERSYKKMLKQRDAEGHTIASVTAIKKNGRSFSCEITSALFTDKNGVEISITTITDRSPNIKKQKKIDDKKEKVVADNIILALAKSDRLIADSNKVETPDNYTAKTPEDVMWDWDLATSKKYISDSVEKVLGEAMHFIDAMQDGRRLRELENKLVELTTIQEEQTEIILKASNLSFDGIWDWNLLNNDFILGEAFEVLFGYRVKSNVGNIADDWYNRLHSDDKAMVEKSLTDAVASLGTHWECTYRFIKADGGIVNVLNRASIFRHADGTAYRVIGAMQDISKQNVFEDRMEQEIKLKEMQIAEASEDAKNMERLEIGKELHDNINQLLFASKMYIERAKRGGDNSEMYLSRSSEYTLMAIEEIRKLTKGLTADIIKDLGLCKAIKRTLRDIMEVNPVKIACVCITKSFKEKSVTDKFKLNVFRIVQEQMNNILKHSQATKVAVSLIQTEAFIKLTIADNGVGFDTTKKQKGIGMANIKNRAASNNGTAEFASKSGEGCVLTVTFDLAKQDAVI